MGPRVEGQMATMMGAALKEGEEQEEEGKGKAEERNASVSKVTPVT